MVSIKSLFFHVATFVCDLCNKIIHEDAWNLELLICGSMVNWVVWTHVVNLWTTDLMDPGSSPDRSQALFLSVVPLT